MCSVLSTVSPSIEKTVRSRADLGHTTRSEHGALDAEGLPPVGTWRAAHDGERPSSPDPGPHDVLPHFRHAGALAASRWALLSSALGGWDSSACNLVAPFLPATWGYKRAVDSALSSAAGKSDQRRTSHPPRLGIFRARGVQAARAVRVAHAAVEMQRTSYRCGSFIQNSADCFSAGLSSPGSCETNNCDRSCGGVDSQCPVRTTVRSMQIALTAEHCALVVQVVPVILIAHVAERRWLHPRTLFVQARVIDATVLLLLTAAFIVCFLAAETGIDSPAATISIATVVCFSVISLAASLVTEILFFPSKGS